MLRRLAVMFLALVTSGVLFAASVADDTVGFSGKVGAHKILDRESLYLLRAVQAKPDDVAALTEGHYFISSVTVDVAPSKDPEVYSEITRYTFTARRRASFLSFGRPSNIPPRKLVLDAYFNKHFRDDVPLIWESSGVHEITP